jgi:hypothetical protein
MKTLLSTLLVAGLILASGSFAQMPAQTAAAGTDVSGQWVGTYVYQDQTRGAGTAVASFQQNGEKLSGDLTMYNPGGRVYTVVGFVSGNEIKLSQPTLGTLKVEGNQITGVLDGWDNARITLQRK